MKSVFKYTCLLAFCCFSTALLAQKPMPPMNLLASYQKYTNRIELAWVAPSVNYQYRVYRKEKGKKTFDLMGSVEQNRYIDRNQLHTNTDYTYYICSVNNSGAESDKSNEAVGAIRVVATQAHPVDTSQSLQECMDVSLTESKFTNAQFVLRFLTTTKCTLTKPMQLTLYRSDDAALDTADNFLHQEPFNIAQKRGALVVKNNGEATMGYLLLKISTEVDSFVVARKIE
jgi:hypothetical protein